MDKRHKNRQKPFVIFAPFVAKYSTHFESVGNPALTQASNPP
jgi:hypothetical protein